MSVPFEIIQQSQRTDYSSFVANVANTCAGDVRVIHEVGSAYLDRIHVRPNFRGLGIGPALLHEAEAWARERDAESVLVVFSPDDPRDLLSMISFFHKSGYRINNIISAVKRF